MLFKSTILQFPFLLILITLNACGGGGSDNGSVAVNTPPTAETQNITINEDSQIVITLSASDQDGSISTFKLTSQPQHGALNGSGNQYTYTPNLNYFGTDEFNFTAMDNDGAESANGIIKFTINAINDTPTITMPETNIIENTLSIGKPVVTDVDDDEINVSLGNLGDSELFLFDSNTGEIQFSQAADFETPLDEGKNNVYQIELVANDGNGGITTLVTSITVEDESILQAQITYPTANANLGGYATTTVVSGNLIDIEDNHVSVQDIGSLTINEISVNLNSNNSRFTTQVPITEDSLQLSLVKNSQSDPVTLSELNIVNQRQAIKLDSPRGGKLDIDNNRLLMIDSGLNAIIAMDLTTKIITVLSDKFHGTGSNFTNAYAITFNPAMTIAYVADSTTGAIFSIELSSGDRTIISDSTIGTGSLLLAPLELTIDQDNNRLLVVDTTLDALIEVDISTGNRNILSNDLIGLGDMFSRPEGVVIDALKGLAYISDSSQDVIFKVDLLSGNRDVLSGKGVGSGIEISSPERIVFSSNNSSLIVADNDSTIYSIDLSNGDRTTIASSSIGSGQDLSTPADIVLGSNDEIWVLDRGLEKVVQINLSTKNREVFEAPTPSNQFKSPSGVIFDSANNRLILIDSTTLYAIDMSDSDKFGKVSELSGPNVGSGDALLSAGELMFDPVNNRVFLVAFGNQDNIYQVDLTTGDRSLLVEPNGFSSSIFLRAATLDITNNRILYIDALQGLVEINLDTGIYKTISDDFSNLETNFNDWLSIAINNETNVAYISTRTVENSSIEETSTLGGVFAIDLNSGISWEIASEFTGSGSQLGDLDSLTFNSTNNTLFAVNDIEGLIFSVDIENGNRQIISSNAIGTPINGAFNIEFDAENKRLFLADFVKSNIYVIDLESGERAILLH